MNRYLFSNENTGVYAALVSLLSSLVAGVACIGPMLGILLGVSGLGWLSRYSYLTVPAAIVSIGLLMVAGTLYMKRSTSCANRRRHILDRFFLIVITLIVIVINIFEFLILPNLLQGDL